jgi:hypothetical protein
VTELDEIIDFRPLADDRVSNPAAIDGRVGPDLDVVLNNDTTELGNLALPFEAGNVAKPIRSDATSGMQNDTVTEQSIKNSCARADRTVATDAHVGTDYGIRGDDGARADFRARPDHSARIDGDVVFQSRGRVNLCIGRYSRRLDQRGRPHCVGKQLGGYDHERTVRIAHAQHCDMRRRGVREAFGEAFADQACACLGDGQGIRKFGAVEKRQVGRSR